MWPLSLMSHVQVSIWHTWTSCCKKLPVVGCEAASHVYTNGQRTQGFGDFNALVCSCCDLDFASSSNIRRQLSNCLMLAFTLTVQGGNPNTKRQPTWSPWRKTQPWHSRTYGPCFGMETFGTEPVSEGLLIHDSLGLGSGLHVNLCEALIANSPVSFSAPGAAPGDHEQALPSNLGHKLLKLLPKSMPSCCTEVQPWGTFCPGVCVLRRKKRVQQLWVESKHCLMLYVGSEVWGDRPQGSEAGRAFQNHWTIFIPAPWQLHIMSEWLKLPARVSDTDQTPLLHCIDP